MFYQACTGEGHFSTSRQEARRSWAMVSKFSSGNNRNIAKIAISYRDRVANSIIIVITQWKPEFENDPYC